MIRLDDVGKVYLTTKVETHALSNINVNIGRGEFVAVMGPSGCGKSTLLSILGLVDRVTSGTYRFDGEDVTTASDMEASLLRREQMGFVFQQFNLLENLSVRQNVELALMYRGMAKEARLRQVSEILERIGLTERGDHRPQQLSGGQQQRVAIARAVVGRPAVIFADEPTGNLDTTNGDEVMRLIGELNIAGTTVVMVTHSKTESERADRVIQMLDGKIVS